MKYLTIISLIAFCNICKSQQFSKCDVYQFEGVDSINKKIVLRETYNSQGLLIYQTYNGYKEDYNEFVDASYFFYYQDTLCIKMTSIDFFGDSSKVLYFHDKHNQLAKYEYFTFGNRVEEYANSNYGQSANIITNEDYEKNRTWKLKSETRYDYDSLGRVSKKHSFADSLLLNIEKFSYFKGSYQCKTTSYDSEGKPKHLKKDDEYYPQTTYTYYLNEKGKVIKEMASTEKGKTTYTEILSYNANGQIEKTVYYNENGEPEITHIYVYY